MKIQILLVMTAKDPLKNQKNPFNLAMMKMTMKIKIIITNCIATTIMIIIIKIIYSNSHIWQEVD